MGLPACLGIVVGDDLQHRPQLDGEDAGDRAIGQRMGPAHEARADDADADVAHDVNPNAPAGGGRFQRGIGEPQRLAAVGDGDRHGPAGLHRVDEGVELQPIGIGIALEEEVQQRLAAPRSSAVP